VLCAGRGGFEEPLPMVTIEAIACGTPVVAKRGGAAPEVIAWRCALTNFGAGKLGSSGEQIDQEMARKGCLWPNDVAADGQTR